jgi:5'-3' exonuclease
VNVHLVDGTYELFRAYYGAPPARSPPGAEVGAVRALLGSVHALLREPAVTHVAVAFDTVIESFRNRLFDGYKTGDGMDPTLFAQFPLAERALVALGVTVWSMIEFEADDALATGAHRYAQDPRVEKVLLCSPDKDLAQCVGGKVVSLDRMRRREIDRAGVVAKFGVPPESIPDYLALVGDTADGIPGVPRWGAKSASAILSAYGSLDAIPDGPWSVPLRGADALARSLREHRSEAALYRTLATLRTDVPLAEALDDLEWRGARRAELAALCEDLGETALPRRISRWREG